MSPRRSRFIARSAARFASPLLAAFLLLPTIAVWAAAGSLLHSFGGSAKTLWPAAAGAAAYGLFEAAFSRPMGLYVFGHELTHVLAAWLSGYRVRSLKVSSAGGEVVTSDTNLFVALAPYCIPLYTVLAAAVIVLARPPVPSPAQSMAGAFAVGFTFAFHAALTFHALRQNQPDLRQAGVLLSLVLILLSNGLILVLLLKFLRPEAVSLAAFGRRWWSLTQAGGLFLWRWRFVGKR